MLILRGNPDEIERGSPPPDPAEVDIGVREAARPLSGWMAVARPAGKCLHRPWGPELGTRLGEALRPLGARGSMREISGSEVGLNDEALSGLAPTAQTPT